MKKNCGALSLTEATFAGSLSTVLGLLFLLAIARPASADFGTAEAAERRGDHFEAYQTCRNEANAGDAECQNLVGYLFQEGLGVSANQTEAIRLFRLAATRGLAIAQCHLGLAYARGLGVSPDETEAVRWYQMAARQGDPIGEYFLAASLAEGTGIVKDRARAIELSRHAANRGYIPAQIELAFLLETTWRTAPQRTEAYIWYRIGSHPEQPTTESYATAQSKGKIGLLSNFPRSKSSTRAVSQTTGNLTGCGKSRPIGRDIGL